MTRERLERLSYPSLREIAEKEGIRVRNSYGRVTLINLILEAMEEDRTEREHLNNLAMRVSTKKYDIVKDEELESQEKKEYPIPERYNETKVTLILRDPYWAFVYWDIKDTDLKEIEGLFLTFELVLRVFETREDTGDGKRITESIDIPVTMADNRWYLNLPRAGSEYHVEFIGRSGKKEKVLCNSNRIYSPKTSISQFGEDQTDGPSKEILILSGLFSIGDSLRNEMIPQRIISLADAKNVAVK